LTLANGSTLATVGAYSTTLTAQATTSLTLPASGYLISSVTQLGANPVTGTPSSTTYLRGDGTWGTPSGGGGSTYLTWQAVQTANFTAVSGYAYPINTTSGAITVTLPASPSAGNYVQLTDYAGTFATNNLTINPNGSKFDGGTNNVLIATNRESIAVVYIDATQGWIPYSGFNTSTPASTSYSASYLLAAGGGGGGWYTGGGGGAGGLLSGTTTLYGGTTYSFVVGAGGTSSTGSAQSTPGTNSTGFALSAIGGGYGGSYLTGPAAGGSGGSGGGGSDDSVYPGGAGGSATSGQGNNGGIGGGAIPYGGGGGGGAGAVGTNFVPATKAGDGGVGVANSITGSSVYYSGGGGGGMSSGSTPGTGGNGGGGAGSTGVGTAGTANTGGGGGGGGSTSPNTGGAGGSGVVIISVPTANYTGVYTPTGAGAPSITTSGSNTILKFTGSGSYTA
jgi:hypothetical protein